jgi:hypothetical protein
MIYFTKNHGAAALKLKEPRHRTSLLWLLSALFAFTSGSNADTAKAANSVVGKPASCGSFQIDITTVDYTKSINGSLGASNASDGAMYVAVQWTYKNMTDEPLSALNKPSIFLASNKGVKMKADVGTSANYASAIDINEKIISQLNPGIKSTTCAVFEVATELFDPFSWKVLVEAGEQKCVFDIMQTEQLPNPSVVMESMGNPLRFGEISVRANTCKTSNLVGSLLIASVQPIDGFVFVEIDWVIENRSSNPINSKDFEMYLVKDDGKKYTPHRAATAFALMDAGVINQVDQNVASNTSLRKKHVFEVPRADYESIKWFILVANGRVKQWFSTSGSPSSNADTPNTDQANQETKNRTGNTDTPNELSDIDNELRELEKKKLRLQQLKSETDNSNEPKAGRQSSTEIWAFPDSSQRLLTESDLAGLSADQLWKVRNEIFARRGYIFSSKKGREFTASLGAAYQGNEKDQGRVLSRMNNFEKANIAFIKSKE